jgi:hypothetical protein
VPGARRAARRPLGPPPAAAAAGELARALHDLQGLLALLGATRAAASMRGAERRVTEETRARLDAATWTELETRLDAVSAQLARATAATS